MKRIFAFMLMLLLLPACAGLCDELYYVANPDAGDRLNLRAEPSTGSVSLGKYYNGVSVTVDRYVNDAWAHVRVGFTQGYMMRKYLKQGSSIDQPVYAMVLSPNERDRLNLRAAPSTNARSKGKFSRGKVVRVLGISDEWAHVEVDGETGYMLLNYLCDADVDMRNVKATQFVCNNSRTQRLNLRAAPSETAVSLGKYYSGTPVRVLEFLPNGWDLVRIGEREGYMMRQFLRGGPAEYALMTFQSFTQQEMRALPDAGSRVYRSLPAGTEATLLGITQDGMAHIVHNGEIGYISKSAVPYVEW